MSPSAESGPGADPSTADPSPAVPSPAAPFTAGNSQADTNDLPLSGLSVIELQAIGPVPFAGMLLRQLGATVIRVVAPSDLALGVAIGVAFSLSFGTPAKRDGDAPLDGGDSDAGGGDGGGGGDS